MDSPIAIPTGTGHDAATAGDVPSDTDRERTQQALSAEYSLLTSALSTAWSASLTRTSIFIFTLSSAGIALGFAAQGGIDRGPFRGLALVVLPVILFLGIATFVRLVQLQRESIVYLTGLNRIRHFLQEWAPSSRPYFVLPPYDDAAAIFRSPGSGMGRHPPRNTLLHMVVQTQGVVGVITAAVAAAFGWLGAAPASAAVAAVLAAVAFVGTLAVLLAYWQRSLAELRNSIRPIHPTPQGDDPPF